MAQALAVRTAVGIVSHAVGLELEPSDAIGSLMEVADAGRLIHAAVQREVVAAFVMRLAALLIEGCCGTGWVHAALVAFQGHTVRVGEGALTGACGCRRTAADAKRRRRAWLSPE